MTQQNEPSIDEIVSDRKKKFTNHFFNLTILGITLAFIPEIILLEWFSMAYLTFALASFFFSKKGLKNATLILN